MGLLQVSFTNYILLHVLATKAYFPLSHRKITKKNRIKNLENLTEPWFKKKCCSILLGSEIKKKSIRRQRNQQQKVPNFPTHMCICRILFFFILKTIKKKDLIG